VFILLEPGMEIKYGDLAYMNDDWETIDPNNTGSIYSNIHFPIKRQIESVNDLFASYNSSLAT